MSQSFVFLSKCNVCKSYQRMFSYSPINQIKQISSGTEKQANATPYYLAITFSSPTCSCASITEINHFILRQPLKQRSWTLQIYSYSLSHLTPHDYLCFSEPDHRPLWLAWVQNWALRSWISAKPDWSDFCWNFPTDHSHWRFSMASNTFEIKLELQHTTVAHKNTNT